MSHTVKYLVSIFGCLLIGWLGGIFTEASVETWYPTLVKPDWTPPEWIFPWVWSFLYILMGISFALIWSDKTPEDEKITAYNSFAAQLFFNAIWSFLFFYLEDPFYGLIDISLLWLAILVTIFAFYRISKLAAILLVPYFLWVSYAWALNAYIWLNNSI